MEEPFTSTVRLKPSRDMVQDQEFAARMQREAEKRERDRQKEEEQRAARRKEAERRGVPFGWTLQVVPGIGHDGRAMSAVCASLWFDGKMPDDAELARLAGQQVA